MWTSSRVKQKVKVNKRGTMRRRRTSQEVRYFDLPDLEKGLTEEELQQMELDNMNLFGVPLEDEDNYKE